MLEGYTRKDERWTRKENERRVGRNRSDIIGRTRGGGRCHFGRFVVSSVARRGGWRRGRDTRGRRWKHELPKEHGWRESVHCYRRGHDNKFTACGDRVRVFIKS